MHATDTATGATLEEVPKEGEAPKINGSAMIAHAATREEVIEVLKNDVYAKGEVWDFEKVCFDRRQSSKTPEY